MTVEEQVVQQAATAEATDLLDELSTWLTALARALRVTGSDGMEQLVLPDGGPVVKPPAWAAVDVVELLTQRVAPVDEVKTQTSVRVVADVRRVLTWVANHDGPVQVTGSGAIKPADLPAVMGLLGLPRPARAPRAMAYVEHLPHVWDVALASELLGVRSGHVHVAATGRAWISPESSPEDQAAAGRAALHACLEVAADDAGARGYLYSWRSWEVTPMSEHPLREAVAAALVQACRGGVVVQEAPASGAREVGTVGSLRVQLCRFLRQLVTDGVVRELENSRYEVTPSLMPAVLRYALWTRVGRWTAMEDARLWRENIERLEWDAYEENDPYAGPWHEEGPWVPVLDGRG